MTTASAAFMHSAMAERSTYGAAVWRQELGGTLALAGPIAATQVAYVSIGVVEALMLGRLGAGELAAGGLGMTLFTIPFLFGLGIVSAIAPIASQARGAREPQMVRRSVRQGLWVATLIGAICVLVLGEAEAIFLLLGQSEANAARAADYTDWARWAMIPGLWLIGLRSFVAVMDRARFALYVMIAGVGFTVVGNYGLMYGNWGLPALGVEGAGIVFAVTNLLMCLALLAISVAERRLRRFAILARFWRPDWDLFREVIRVGVPIGGMMLLEHLLFATAIFMMGILGTEFLAAHMVAIRCISLVFMVPLGVAQAATIRVGIAVGRRDPEAARMAGWVALAIGAGFMSCSALLFALAPLTLTGLFLDRADPANAESVRIAVSLLLVAAGFQLVDGCQTISAGILRGMKDTRIPMIIAAIGYWAIGFPTSWFLGFVVGLDGVGIWLGLAVGLATVALLLTYRFAKGRRLLPAPAAT